MRKDPCLLRGSVFWTWRSGEFFVDVIEPNEVVPIVSTYDVQGYIPYSRGKHTDDRGGKGYLHIVGHLSDVARGESDKGRAHRDERTHQTEYGSELGEYFGRTQTLFTREFVPTDEQIATGGICIEDFGQHIFERSVGAFGRFGSEGFGVEAGFVFDDAGEGLLPAAVALPRTEEGAEEEKGFDEEIDESGDYRYQQAVGDPKHDVGQEVHWESIVSEWFDVG